MLARPGKDMLREEPVAVCPQCESTVRREARFCDQCGWSLSSGESIAGHDTLGLEVVLPGEAGDGTLRPDRGIGIDRDAGERFEPVGGSEAYREPQGHRATFQERVRGGIRTLVLWSGSPLLLLVVVAGAVARDNFRRVESQVAPSVQGVSSETVPGDVPGMSLPLEIVIPFTARRRPPTSRRSVRALRDRGE